ncbi:MAG: 8-oxo-dGTP pyrophosphatase MutT (NUDIX family) [Myxococcota bacterium]|jgi:8-oxo-dGTP pyrophosphatase MutT (NUDIX family)
MRALADVAGDPFARTHWDPGHFTASSFVLSPERDAVLLILHGKLGRWLQPGGHVDPDDVDIVAAARREVAEEVSLTGLPFLGRPEVFDVDVHTIPSLGGSPAHAHFDVRFAFVAADRDAVAGSDALDVQWVALDAIHTVQTDESVLRAVRKLRARA